jgi:hypothetical protein
MFLFRSTLPPHPPATAKAVRGKGVRSMGAHRATHPCGASGVSGSDSGSATLMPMCSGPDCQVMALTIFAEVPVLDAVISSIADLEAAMNQ